VSVLLMIFSTSNITATPQKTIDIKALSQKLDQMYRSSSSISTVSMQIVTPHYQRKLTMHMTTRGMQDTLIRIMSPRKEKGISTLKRGYEMWNYLPKVKKVIRVPASMMSNSWMGSDLTNDDLVKNSSFEKDYIIKQYNAPENESCLCYTPKENAPVTWSKVIACFDQKHELPKRQSFYDEKGKHVRDILYENIKDVGGRTIPTRISFLPLSEEKKGNQTILTFEKIVFDVDIKDFTFSQANLRRGR
jgi:outer membrane lipoprotein-sorting protein